MQIALSLTSGLGGRVIPFRHRLVAARSSSFVPSRFGASLFTTNSHAYGEKVCSTSNGNNDDGESSGFPPGLELVSRDYVTPSFLKSPRTVGVVGAPMLWGQPHVGTDYGSKLLREFGLQDNLKSLGWVVNDRGEIKCPAPSPQDPQYTVGNSKALEKAKNAYSVGQGLKLIHERAYESMKNDEFALILGGDHSIGAATVAAALRARPDSGIIWVDAHADINTPESSPSGNMHGMPLGILMGLCDYRDLPGWEWLEGVPKLKPEQVVFVGLRDVDVGERRAISSMGIKALSMFEIDRFGIGTVMDMAIEHLSGRPIHLSYDIDAVDPEIAPSTGTAVRGGLTFREAHFVAEILATSKRLGSMDLVEVNPRLVPGEGSESTAKLGTQLILSAMGGLIL